MRLAILAASIVSALSSACTSSTPQPADAGPPDCATPAATWTLTPSFGRVDDVAVTPAGDVAVAALACGGATCTDSGATVALFGTDGALRWTLSHGTADWRPTVAAASDGTIVAGESGGVVVLEPSGTPRFERRVAGACAFDVGVDALGRVYGGGSVHAAADFGTGSAVSGVVLVSYERDGRTRWARVVAPGVLGADCSHEETRIATSADGTTVIALRGVLASFAPDGTELWRKPFNVQELHALAVDPAGRAIVGGALAFGSQRDLGTGDLGAPTGYDGFVAVYERDGTPRWSRRLAGMSFVYVYGVAADDAGNVYVTGHFGDPTGGTLDLGGAVLTATASTNQLFVVSYDSTGTLRWARGPGDGLIVGRGVAAGLCGEVVVGGMYAGPGTFLDGSPSPSTTSVGQFVTRFVP